MKVEGAAGGEGVWVVVVKEAREGEGEAWVCGRGEGEGGRRGEGGLAWRLVYWI